ncbi:uncharacterized protein LOC129294480 isoform X2 [Prosopis cineraria]|uniref:uncharacterized protein LOC129294480 isoform X2 n=1 Tax=Prosopis cineraria TaxID=364024 RepID=UPI00241071CC|nr:uncharacterized protein LOC129294480 isoform X2 [Prosopis cineraria]
MDGSAVELSPNNLGTPKRRNARRKFVQSTLFPQKAQESNDRADDQQEEEEARCCANENGTGRPKQKVTPRTKNSKIKEKLPQNATSENMGTPKRRNVRRKLVQSTLSPQKTQESNDRADEQEENNVVDDQQEKEEAHCCVNENEKGNSNPKVTPRSKNPKKKEKQLQNTTPKKRSPKGVKGSGSRQMLTNVAQISMAVPDLRLEAKLSAEENSRIFAGRQMHPFFSSWKVEKKPQEAAESELSLYAARRKDEQVLACAPIHVFENNQDVDDTSLPDWKNWTFLGQTDKANYVSQNVLSYSDQHSIESTQPQVENSASLDGGQTSLQPPEAKLDMKANTEQAGIFRKSDPEPQSRFLQESMRSYYHSCGDKAEGTLWTHKYKPTKAFEVCGNDESVKFLRDWLHLWHGRRYQSRKDASCRDKSDMHGGGGDDDDYDCSHCDYDSEDMTEGDSLENVLLITGPIGSGKSAAIYACAQEEGFEVLELNTSDCRNGTAVKQHFGDALGSLGFKRLLEHTDGSPMKKKRKLSLGLALPSNKASDELNEGVIGPIAISDDEVCPVATSCMLPGQRNLIGYDKVQTLILVEDVDILFPEDRGCIAAIQQIAETAKGPIILTCNSYNPALPDNFSRRHVSFSLPSTKELLCHLYMVCVTEGVNIDPFVLEKFIQFCDGDIRKTVMHLQFWFQSKRLRKDKKAQKLYGSLPFDLEVGHQILPKMMPWGFPSQLSELIEKEVTRVITTMEENSSLQGLVEEQLDLNEKQSDSDVKQVGTDYIESKKVEMLERNGSVTDYSQLEAQFHALSEISNSFGTPVAPSKRKIQRKLVVMSSGSEDEDLNNGHPLDMCDDADNGPALVDNSDTPSKLPMNKKYTSVSFFKRGAGLEESEVDLNKHLRTADVMCSSETSKSLDVSCVPESTFVPETLDEIETISGAVSCGNGDGPLEVSVNNELPPFTFSVRKRLAKRVLDDDLLGSTKIPESSQKEIVQDLIDENMEPSPVYDVMDECSRVDFKMKSNFVEPFPSMGTDVIHKIWRELRECRADLRQHAATEQPGAFEVVKLACGISNLISEADLLFGNLKQKECDILEAPTSLFNEATFNWYDEQMMVSTVAEHGFCFYAKHLSDMGLKSDCKSNVDLTSEILTSTTSMVALGYLSRQGLSNRTNSCTRKDFGNKSRNDLPDSQMQTSLFSVVQSTVPARLSLALKGVAFNEYLSSLRLIARLEDLRISQGAEKTRRRRARGAQHYLSKGTMILSREDISLLGEGDLYRKNFSKHIGASNQVDSNFT